MDVNIEALGAADFDATAWLNAQVAAGAVDGGQLHVAATKLHFLATTAQQNSDRVRARVRAQGAAAARDAARLVRHVRLAQQQAQEIEAAVDAQAAAAPALERVVAIGRARRQMARTVAALERVRDCADLPRRIDALVSSGDVARAWALVDGLGESADAHRKRLEAAAIGQLRSALASGDSAAAAHAARLLTDHGSADVAGAELLSQRTKAARTRLLGSQVDGSGSDAVALAGRLSDIIADERALADAVDVPGADALVAALVTSLAADVQPAIERRVMGASADDLPHLLQSLAGQLGAELEPAGSLCIGATPEPLSPILELFEPFITAAAALGNNEAARIRNGSLQRLEAVELSSRADILVQDGSDAIASVFADVDLALRRVGAFVPPSRAAAAIAAVLEPVLESAQCLDKLIAQAADAGLADPDKPDSSSLRGSGLLDAAGAIEVLDAPGTAPESAACQALTSDSKLDAATQAVALALLSSIFERHAMAAAAEARLQWDNLTALAADPPHAPLAAFLDDHRSPAELRAVAHDLAAELLEPAAQVEAGAAALARRASMLVLLHITGPFRPALGRVGTSAPVPARFSCSPSEEAVDVGERIHLLLPELEQLAAVHAQLARRLPSAQPLYAYVLHCLREPLDDTEPIAAALALVLRAVLRAFARRASELSQDVGVRRQLAADARYISAVATSFAPTTADTVPDFAALLQSFGADESDATS
ncbi:hypothetical protein GGF46_002281 [Coemansia sp. RSA 552]|nr:hypothetical protein GGF46_002281 [Coemansia sp. RSA 552]